MANTNEKLQTLKKLHSREEDIYSEKNEKYGDSFSTTYKKRGPTAALIRMEDKLSRADHMFTHGLRESGGESLIDTLMDLSNYANLTIMELMEEDTPQESKAPRKKKAKKEKDNSPQETKEAEDKGPLGDLSKKQLVEVISALGGTVPKKANREKMISVIQGFPKAKVAVAITSMKANPVSQEEEEIEGEE